MTPASAIHPRSKMIKTMTNTLAKTNTQIQKFKVLQRSNMCYIFYDEDDPMTTDLDPTTMYHKTTDTKTMDRDSTTDPNSMTMDPTTTDPATMDPMTINPVTRDPTNKDPTMYPTTTYMSKQ